MSVSHTNRRRSSRWQVSRDANMADTMSQRLTCRQCDDRTSSLKQRGRSIHPCVEVHGISKVPSHDMRCLFSALAVVTDMAKPARLCKNLPGWLAHGMNQILCSMILSAGCAAPSSPYGKCRQPRKIVR